MLTPVKLAQTITLGCANHRFDTGVTADPSATSSKIFLNGSTTALAYAPAPADCGLGLSITTLTFSGANGFAIGDYCSVFILATQADGTLTAVGRADFYITTRGPDDLAFPATSGRSILVAAAGGVAPDWANVQGASTTVGLSGTTVKTATDIATAITTLASDAAAGLVAVLAYAASATDMATVLSRLSAARAGYLDNLSAGAVALASALSTAQTAITAIKTKTDQFVFTVANHVDATATLGTDAISAAAVSAAAVTKIRDGFLSYSYASGRTVVGYFRRAGSSLEKATGLKSTTVAFLTQAGATIWSIAQSVTSGTRGIIDLGNTEDPP